MQRNFHTKYRPGKELSLDESTCPFKGRVHFKCYNPKKPNRFHIKLFMVSEPSTGYICGFEVYTGEASGQSQGNVQEVQDASKTSCKKTNYKGQKVMKPQPVFLYNRYMSGVDLTDQFLQYYSFLHKSVKWSKKFFVHCLNMVILNAHILHKKYLDSKTMHWQFRIQLVKHMLSNAQQQPWGIAPVPESSLCLVERHFIEPIPGQEGTRRKHPSCTCFICYVSREAL